LVETEKETAQRLAKNGRILIEFADGSLGSTTPHELRYPEGGAHYVKEEIKEWHADEDSVARPCPTGEYKYKRVEFWRP